MICENHRQFAENFLTIIADFIEFDTKESENPFDEQVRKILKHRDSLARLAIFARDDKMYKEMLAHDELGKTIRSMPTALYSMKADAALMATWKTMAVKVMKAPDFMTSFLSMMVYIPLINDQINRVTLEMGEQYGL